jgi:hypothetical protein
VSRIDGPGGLTQKYNMIANSIYADKYVNTGTFFLNESLVLLPQRIYYFPH